MRNLKALEILQDLRGQGYNDPAILAAIAQSHVSLGIDYRDRREMGKSLDNQKEAVRILEQLNPGAKGNVTLLAFQKDLGKAYQEVGITLTSLERHQAKEALEFFDKARKLFEDKSQYRKNSAEVKLLIGEAHLQLKDSAQALKPLEEASALIAQVLKELPKQGTQTEHLRTLQARVLSSQAKAHHLEGDVAKAQELFVESLNVRESLAKTGIEPIVVNGFVALAEFYNKEKKVTEAILNYDQAINRQEKWIEQSPQDFTRLRAAGVMLYNKGLMLDGTKRKPEALDSYLRAKKHEIEAFRLSDRNDEFGAFLYYTLKNLFAVQIDVKKYEDALETVEECGKLWPDDAKKQREAAERLATVYKSDSSPKALDRIVAFFDRALAKGFVDADDIIANARYRDLRANPKFAELIRKYGK